MSNTKKLVIYLLYVSCTIGSILLIDIKTYIGVCLLYAAFELLKIGMDYKGNE